MRMGVAHLMCQVIVSNRFCCRFQPVSLTDAIMTCPLHLIICCTGWLWKCCCNRSNAFENRDIGS